MVLLIMINDMSTFFNRGELRNNKYIQYPIFLGKTLMKITNIKYKTMFLIAFVAIKPTTLFT